MRDTIPNAIKGNTTILVGDSDRKAAYQIGQNTAYSIESFVKSNIRKPVSGTEFRKNAIGWLKNIWAVYKVFGNKQAETWTLNNVQENEKQLIINLRDISQILQIFLQRSNESLTFLIVVLPQPFWGIMGKISNTMMTYFHKDKFDVAQAKIRADDLLPKDYRKIVLAKQYDEQTYLETLREFGLTATNKPDEFGVNVPVANVPTPTDVPRPREAAQVVKEAEKQQKQAEQQNGANLTPQQAANLNNNGFNMPTPPPVGKEPYEPPPVIYGQPPAATPEPPKNPFEMSRNPLSSGSGQNIGGGYSGDSRGTIQESDEDDEDDSEESTETGEVKMLIMSRLSTFQKLAQNYGNYMGKLSDIAGDVSDLALEFISEEVGALQQALLDAYSDYRKQKSYSKSIKAADGIFSGAQETSAQPFNNMTTSKQLVANELDENSNADIKWLGVPLSRSLPDNINPDLAELIFNSSSGKARNAMASGGKIDSPADLSQRYYERFKYKFDELSQFYNDYRNGSDQDKKKLNIDIGRAPAVDESGTSTSSGNQSRGNFGFGNPGAPKIQPQARPTTGNLTGIDLNNADQNLKNTLQNILTDWNVRMKSSQSRFKQIDDKCNEMLNMPPVANFTVSSGPDSNKSFSEKIIYYRDALSNYIGKLGTSRNPNTLDDIVDKTVFGETNNNSSISFYADRLSFITDDLKNQAYAMQKDLIKEDDFYAGLSESVKNNDSSLISYFTQNISEKNKAIIETYKKSNNNKEPWVPILDRILESKLPAKSNFVEDSNFYKLKMLALYNAYKMYHEDMKY